MIKFPDIVVKRFKEAYPKASTHDVKYAFKAAEYFFSVCKKNKGKMIPMPSEVVDEIWHLFILCTKDYQNFCKQYMGYFLHHTPNDGKHDENSFEQILALWVMACNDENFKPTSKAAKPSLFYVDVRFGLKDKQYLENLATNIAIKLKHYEPKEKVKKNIIMSFFTTLFSSKVSESLAKSSDSFLDLYVLLNSIHVSSNASSGKSSSSDNGNNSDTRHHHNDSGDSTTVHTTPSCNSCSSCSGGGD